MSKESLKKALREIVQTVSLPNEMEKRGVDVFHIGARKKAVCPFHGDTDPSLVIYEDDHPHGHCFGCGKHFDVVGFVHEWGLKFEQNWDFKKTLAYFRDNFKITSIINPNEMDNSFLEEEGYQVKINENVLIDGDYYRSSNVIKNALRDSPHPEFDLQKMKPFLKSMDEAVYASQMDTFKEKESSIIAFLPQIEKIRYSQELSEYNRYLMGNPEGRIMVITDHGLHPKIISAILNSGKRDNNVLFLIITDTENRGVMPNVIALTRVADCWVFGNKAYSALFPEAMKSLPEIAGSQKTVTISGKEIRMGFKTEDDIKSWAKEEYRENN